MGEARSGFSAKGRRWTPEDSAILRGACDLVARQLGDSHGDRGVATLLALPCSMPNGVVIELEKITPAQRTSLRAAVSKCLKKPPPSAALLAGLRELEALLG